MGLFVKMKKNVKDLAAGRSSILFKLCIILFTVVLYLLLPIQDASAASFLNLYNYTTKKDFRYYDKRINVKFNDKKISNDKTPGILVNGIALVSYKDVFSDSGIAAQCTYKSNQGSISITKNDITIQMTIGSTKAVVNGEKVTMPAAPVKIRYTGAGNVIKVLVPSRFVCETLGYSYTWHSDTDTVEIRKSDFIMSYSIGKVYDYNGSFGNVTIDGKNINLGSMPSIITNNITMLRAKKVFADSKIGAKYKFNEADQTVTLSRNGKELVMKIGSTVAYLNGSAEKLDMAPVIVTNLKTKTSYVMVPGYFTASCLGFDYTWNNKSRTSVITTRNDNNSTNNSSANNNSNQSNNPGQADHSGQTNNSGNSDQTNGQTSANNAVITDAGVILNEWNAADNLTGTGSDHKEINSDLIPASDGMIHSVNRDYNNVKMNSETYMILSNTPIGKVTSDKSGKKLKILIPGIATNDQTFQIYGASGNLVNTISTSNQSGEKTSIIDFSILPEHYTYDLSVSENRTIIYVTIYVNSINNIKIGANNTQDYITVTGLYSPKAVVSRQNGMLYIDFPYTVNGTGSQNTAVSGSKYVNFIYTVSTPDKTQMILGINESCKYAVYEKDNQYSIILSDTASQNNQNGQSNNNQNGQNSNNQTGQSNNNQSGQNSNNQTGQNNNNQNGQINNSSIADKSKYEIIIPKPEGINREQITDSDDYYNDRFSIKLPGDYTSILTEKQIIKNSNVIKDISVYLNNNNETVIRITTTKLQGYEYVTDKDNIYVNIGNPRDIYKNIVVLDPGHGGYANGAHYFSTDEKDINYKILYTIGKKYFNSDPSKLKVYYTRETDTDKSLAERASYASKVGADLFVSLHMNASTYSGAYGTEVYYSDYNNSPNKTGLTSRRLAAKLLYNLTTELGTSNRGEKSEIYTVVHRNTVPAVLIELGFLSNKNDFSKLSDSAFQDKTAKIIYETLLQVFKEYPTGR